MIGNGVDAKYRRQKKRGIIRRVAHGTWSENPDVRRRLFYESMKHLEIMRKGGCAIAGRRATNRRQVRLVHELGRSDAATSLAGCGNDLSGLIRLPYSFRVARAWAGGKGRNDRCIDRLRKVDHTVPLATRQHALVSRRWARRRGAGPGEECRVRPGAADAQVGRRQSGGRLPQY